LEFLIIRSGHQQPIGLQNFKYLKFQLRIIKKCKKEANKTKVKKEKPKIAKANYKRKIKSQQNKLPNPKLEPDFTFPNNSITNYKSDFQTSTDFNFPITQISLSPKQTLAQQLSIVQVHL